MPHSPETRRTHYNWMTQPKAALWVRDTLDRLTTASDLAERLSHQLLDSTGTRLGDLIDHLRIRDTPEHRSDLATVGFSTTLDDNAEAQTWHHTEGLFPRVRLVQSGAEALAIRVERIEDFLAAHDLSGHSPVEGTTGQPLRYATIACDQNVALLIVERHGHQGFAATTVPPEQLAAAERHHTAFSNRQREFDDDADGFTESMRLIDKAVQDLGADWTCDLFFQAERAYWQGRNRAARIQRRRQAAAGIGWANHDHHTYRSSRESFHRLIVALERMGFVCRERFYAGQDAGWGAQVLEQPVCQMVIFADVDLTPTEIAGDIAHQRFAPTKELGTVGLWCRLHGEAFLRAGMHHLECQFDFDAVRSQLAAEGVPSMAPFTDFPHLRQAFTEPEIWPVARDRLDAALADGLITSEQASAFADAGAPGSHLEILERNQGYKGFNQSGVSDIILRTDPRRIRS